MGMINGAQPNLTKKPFDSLDFTLNTANFAPHLSSFSTRSWFYSM
jgi:hypothetical protein